MDVEWAVDVVLRPLLRKSELAPSSSDEIAIMLSSRPVNSERFWLAKKVEKRPMSTSEAGRATKWGSGPGSFDAKPLSDARRRTQPSCSCSCLNSARWMASCRNRSMPSPSPRDLRAAACGERPTCVFHVFIGIMRCNRYCCQRKITRPP